MPSPSISSYKVTQHAQHTQHASEAIKAAWAEHWRVTESGSTCEPIAWLRGKRSYTGERPHWFDHGTRWCRDGKPVMLVGQPYELNDEDVEALGQLRAEGFDVWVGMNPSWYYPGHVMSVIVALRGATVLT